MKAAKNFFGTLRQEVALDVRDDQNQNAQQHHDFDGVIEKELHAAAHPARRVQPACLQRAADQAVQPLHTKNFILEKVPSGRDCLHHRSPKSKIFDFICL